MGCCASESTGTQNERLAEGSTGVRLEKKPLDPSAMGINKKVEDPLAKRKKEYAKNPPIQIGYWKIRGQAQPIRYLLEYCEHPYEETMYEQGDAPNFSVECWTSVRNTLGLDFPTIPYIIDGENRLTDLHAIMLYVATAYCPEILGKDDR